MANRTPHGEERHADVGRPTGEAAGDDENSMSRLESVLEEARKLQLEERRRLATRLLEEGDTSGTALRDERLEAMLAAASDELFLADLTATMEDFTHADRDGLPA
jgi:hypothetical protein